MDSEQWTVDSGREDAQEKKPEVIREHFEERLAALYMVFDWLGRAIEARWPAEQGPERVDMNARDVVQLTQELEALLYGFVGDEVVS